MTEVKNEGFIELLKSSTLGQSLMSEVEQKKLDERIKLAKELAELHTDADAAYPKYESLKQDALVAVRAAERALAEAQAKFWAIEHERSSKSLAYDIRRNQIETALRQGASPEIDKFKSKLCDLHGELTTGYAKYLRRESRFVGIPPNRYEQVVSNAASIKARRRAIFEAMHGVEDLKLEPDQGSIPERLAAILANLPPIDDKLPPLLPPSYF